MMYKDSYCYNYGKKDERKEKEDTCVEINIKCGEKEHAKKEDGCWPKPEYDKENGDKQDYGKKPEDRKEGSCVVINIFCEGKEEKDKKPYPQTL